MANEDQVDVVSEIRKELIAKGVSFTNVSWLETDAIVTKALRAYKAEIKRLREVLAPMLAEPAPPASTPREDAAIQEAWTHTQGCHLRTRILSGDLTWSKVCTCAGLPAPEPAPSEGPKVCEMACCMKCGAEEYDVPLVETEIGMRLRKKCSVCGGQLVSNPRRG